MCNENTLIEELSIKTANLKKLISERNARIEDMLNSNSSDDQASFTLALDSNQSILTELLQAEQFINEITEKKERDLKEQVAQVAKARIELKSAKDELIQCHNNYRKAKTFNVYSFIVFIASVFTGFIFSKTSSPLSTLDLISIASVSVVGIVYSAINFLSIKNNKEMIELSKEKYGLYKIVYMVQANTELRYIDSLSTYKDAKTQTKKALEDYHNLQSALISYIKENCND